MNDASLLKTDIAVSKISKAVTRRQDPRNTRCRNRGTFYQKKSSESKGCVGQNWHSTCCMIQNYNPNITNVGTNWISFRPIGNIWVQNLWNFNKKKKHPRRGLLRSLSPGARRGNSVVLKRNRFRWHCWVDSDISLVVPLMDTRGTYDYDIVKDETMNAAISNSSRGS